ncbi:MAG: tetratricopeptide repeat protein [Muribaculaceae bacterium]|nr:tetratricopeptide repeat protein [Muribaculaceae bacterium]
MKKKSTICVRLASLLAMLAMTVAARAQINTDQVVTIGRNALYFEDYILAIQYFNQAIKAKPFLAEPYFYRSVAKISLEDYGGAEQDAGMAIERNPFIVDAYQVRGVARQNLRNYVGAVEDYDAGLELMPEDKNMLMNRAVCEIELKNYDEAQQTFERLLQLDRRNDRAYLGLAQMSLAREDTVAALDNLNRSIALSKNNPGAYVMRAEIATRMNKDFEGALADMDSAILLEPHYAGYFINRAYMKYNLDDYFGAMADYDYAIGLDPASQEAHFNRGLLRAEVGDNNKAITDFDFVLKTNPSNFIALYNRALLHMRTGQYREAVSDFTAILKKYPNFEAGYMARGEAKKRMGDYKGGGADYEKAMAIFRRNKTHVSTFNPVEIEVAAIKKAEQRALNDVDEPETAEEIMDRFNTLLTVKDSEPVKPEYANRQRGHVQNDNVEVEPMPMFTLSYYDKANGFNGNLHYTSEIGDINDARLLPLKLTLVAGETALDEEAIQRHFSSIEYYNSLLSLDKARSVDYFARGLDYLLVKNPEAAISDADNAIALSPNFTLAYVLRSDAHYMQYLMAQARDENASELLDGAPDAKSQAMLRQRQDVTLIDLVMDDLDQIIKLSPKNVYAHYNKGNAYMLQGDYTSAISCYTNAIQIKPDLAEAYYNRGLMYLRMGNKAAGVADLSKAGELGVLPSYNVLKRMTR